ncbi:MerR family transcriptional regulator [Streptomyces sp. NPDC001941]|uniref:helix-turn-helix domain-containing protein n=1 Tax=Streptomyces sp. NPDC001941 TaxID=3154659 RepID=UPI0033349BD8
MGAVVGGDGVWSIGELAERAGVSVKAVRFYSDRGLLPEGVRSAGGHRRYGQGALERLRLIRSLRGLGVPVAEVGRALAGHEALEGVLAGRLREVGAEVVALRWREAGLRALRDCPADERVERLRLVGALDGPPDASVLARFWRRVLPWGLPERQLARVLAHAVPGVPEDPSPEQVVGFARLHDLVARPRRASPLSYVAFQGADSTRACRPGVLYEGLFEAHALASPGVRAGRVPGGGEALDCYVAAHARARGRRDTGAFRRELSALMVHVSDPVLDRYWEVVAELSGEVTAGVTDVWLRAALEREAG